MNKFFYKQNIDGIYLNYEDHLNEEYILENKNYDLIDVYPKTKAVLEALEIEKRLFYLTKNTASKKMYINTDDVFLKFQNSLKSNKKDNEKSLSIQLKGHYCLTHTYQDLKEFYLKTEPKSTSKIEIAFDFEASSKFLKETALIFLDKKNYTNFEGSKTFINCENDDLTGISYLNSSRVFKVYQKRTELKNNPKKGLYYEKNPEFSHTENLYRIEIGFITSKKIKAVLDLDTKIRDEKIDETTLINLIKSKFFTDFKIHKKSELKSIIKHISLAQ